MVEQYQPEYPRQEEKKLDCKPADKEHPNGDDADDQRVDRPSLNASAGAAFAKPELFKFGVATRLVLKSCLRELEQ